MTQKNNIKNEEHKTSEVHWKINEEVSNSLAVCSNKAITSEDASYRRIIYKFAKNYNDDATSYYKEKYYNEVFTFKLPNGRSIQDIRSIEFVNSIETKSSWGNKAYYGKNINDMIKDEKFTEISSNNSMCYYGDIIAYRKKIFELLNKKDWDGSAVFISKQLVIFNWFFLDNDYYFQIAYNQYAETWGSSTGGAMWINLGSDLIVNLYD